MNKEELKPCPFCGVGVRWCGSGNDNPEDDHECHQVHCDSCGIQFDVENAESKDAESIEYLREITAKAWNTRAPQSEWVSVKDRLPSEDGFIIARSIGGVSSDSRYSTGTCVLYFSHLMEKGCEFHSQHRASHVTVTHWMPLPNPPEGD